MACYFCEPTHVAASGLYFFFFWHFAAGEHPGRSGVEVSTSDTVTALVGGSVTMRNCSAGGFCCCRQEKRIHSGQSSILSNMATLLLLLFAISVFFFLSFPFVQAMIRWRWKAACVSTAAVPFLGLQPDWPSIDVVTYIKEWLGWERAHTERSTNTAARTGGTNTSVERNYLPLHK